jgi:RHS repeat-associated protein
LNNTVFGEHAPNANPDGDSLSYTLNLRYPGQYADAESGMNYNYRRDYEPATGRYIESDPVGLKGGSNTYRYVDADPLTGIDPRGLWKAYGFWCGPNWTGGKNEEFSPEHVYKRPEDRLDTACMNHDMCFYTCRAGYPCDLIGRQKCFKKCDSILSAEAYAVGGFSGNSIGFTMNHASHDGEKADPNCKFCEPTGK